MAIAGFEYWALVARPVLQALLLTLGVWLRCRWLPGRPAMTPAAREMLRLGLNSTGFSLLDFVGRSSDRVAIGYRSGAVPLGYYQNAMFVYDNVLDLLVSPLHGVAVAGLSKARGNLGELRRLWHKALQTLAFFAMPAFGILAVTAQDLIEMLLGSKWANAGFLLGILALRGIPHCIERTLGWLHVTAGRTERWMRWGVLATCAQLTALACGLPFGPTGVVVAFVICTFALCIPAIAYSGTPLGIGAADVVDAVWRPMAGSLLAAATGFAVRHAWAGDFTAIGRVAALTAVYATVYLTIVVKLLGVRTPLQVAFALVGDALPDRFARVARSLRMFHGRE
jgi:PST family polysaccharide transporter